MVSTSLTSLSGAQCNSLDLAAIILAVATAAGVDPALVAATCPAKRRRELFYLPQRRQSSSVLINIVGVDYATLQAIFAKVNSPTFLTDINNDLAGEGNDFGSASTPTVDNSNPAGILILHLF